MFCDFCMPIKLLIHISTHSVFAFLSTALVLNGAVKGSTVLPLRFASILYAGKRIPTHIHIHTEKKLPSSHLFFCCKEPFFLYYHSIGIAIAYSVLEDEHWKASFFR